MYSDPWGYYGWWDFYRSKFVVAGLLNLVIAAITGGSVKLISKMLSQRIKDFGKFATSKFLEEGLKKMAKKIALSAAFQLKVVKVFGVLVTVVTTFLDVGGFIFDYVDARDKNPRSGYWDL